MPPSPYRFTFLSSLALCASILAGVGVAVLVYVGVLVSVVVLVGIGVLVGVGVGVAVLAGIGVLVGVDLGVILNPFTMSQPLTISITSETIGIEVIRSGKSLRFISVVPFTHTSNNLFSCWGDFYTGRPMQAGLCGLLVLTT